MHLQALLLLLCFFFQLQASRGCLDNSYHAEPCAPYDYKNYHRVKCNCACERYAHSLDRNTCRHCGHYHIPDDSKIKIHWKRTPSKSTNVRRKVTRLR